jgi:acyl-CoA thioesterase-1
MKMNSAWVVARSIVVLVALRTLFVFPAQAQIVAIGASNTAGYGVGASQAFPAQLEAMLRAKGSAMHVANAGISGDTTAGMLSRLGTDVPAGTKIVILQFGGNDFRKGRSGADRPANIVQIESQLRGRGIKWVLADGLVKAALQAGLRQPDGQHLTVEGHRQVAAALVRSIR